MRGSSLQAIRARVDRLAISVGVAGCDGSHVRLQCIDVWNDDPIPDWPPVNSPTHCPCGAELTYLQAEQERVALKPGWRATVRVQIPNEDSKFVSPWSLKVEVLANPIWRRGRLFYRCPACGRRATRLYVPFSGLQPRCRRCWGLSYESQSWSYEGGPVAYVTTLCRREERHRAARARYDARRAFLVKQA
jgi:hypothetical protein